MTPMQRFMATLRCEPNATAATIHWWGLYKFAHAGLIDGYEGSEKAWRITGTELADIDAQFYEDFLPDSFHLSTGHAKGRRATWFSDQANGDQSRLMRTVRNLESYEAIDEYIALISLTEQEVLDGGEFDHVRALSTRYGGTVPILLNEGNPISNILDPHGCVGFEEGLVGMLEEPDKMEYLIQRSYEAILPRMKALKASGADGYIGSETYCAPDLISPDLWRTLILPAQAEFYQAIERIGMIPICYFLGDVLPILDDIKGMGIRALMVEEGKKTFPLPIGEIYDRLEQSICLFGNLDSVYVLERGTEDEVRQEVRRQIYACKKGGFIMSNGCPVSFGTPPKNIYAMIDEARQTSEK